MRTDLLTQASYDRIISFGSADMPREHDEIAAQYALWYGLSVSVWYAVVLGAHVDVPSRMRDWRHYLDAVGYTL